MKRLQRHVGAQMVPQKKRPIVFPFGTAAGWQRRFSQFFGLKEKILIAGGASPPRMGQRAGSR